MTTGFKNETAPDKVSLSISDPKSETSNRQSAIDYRQISIPNRQFAWRVWLPTIALIAVAVLQVVLAKTAYLGPWKGGGFGMFSTTDGTSFRYVRVFVEAPERSEELEVAPSQEIAASRAELYPSEAMMSGLAREVIAREERYGRPVGAVRLEIWRTEFESKSLYATARPLRTFTFYPDHSHADQTLNRSRE